MAKRKSTKGQTTIYKTSTQVHWSDESRFFLHVTDGRVRVWRQPNTAYAERNIVETLSYDCKLDLITVRGNLNEQIYRQNILEASVVPHFDNHPLNTRPVFMDDNARPTELVL